MNYEEDTLTNEHLGSIAESLDSIADSLERIVRLMERFELR